MPSSPDHKAPECPVCGEAHETVKALGESIFVRACPRLPENTIYQHFEFEHGPPGLLRVLCKGNPDAS